MATPVHHALAVISRFDSLCEIVSLTMLEIRKLGHLGIDHLPRRSTLSDANARRPEKVFEQTCRSLYERHRDKLSYRARWAIELLFKQIKQNFPLRYFYGESANAIKIQIWVVLIANLLLSLLQHSTTRSWSFSGLATVVRIALMYYIDINSFLNNPEKDWEKSLQRAMDEDIGGEGLRAQSLNRGLGLTKNIGNPC